jgi:hypothetical protein
METTEKAALIKYSNFRNVKIGGIGSKILYRSCHPAWGDRCDYYVQRFAERANIGLTPEEINGLKLRLSGEISKRQ